MPDNLNPESLGNTGDKERQMEIAMQKKAAQMFEKLKKYYEQTKAINLLEQETDLGPSVILDWCTRDRISWPSPHNREIINRALKRLCEQIPADSLTKTVSVVTVEKNGPKTWDEYGLALSRHWGVRIFSQDEIYATDEFLAKLLDQRIIKKARAVSGIKMYKISPEFLTRLRHQKEQGQQ